MTTTPPTEPIEWVCGLDPDPTRDGQGLARSFVVIWIRDGDLIDAAGIDRRLTAERIVACFLATTREPKAGRPHVPDRIRVSSPEVAEMLRAGVGPGVEVVCAPTPELEAMEQRMKERESRRVADDGSGETYLGGGVSISGVSRFFTFVARLYRVAPWDHVPDDCIIGVACERLGIDAAVLAVTGQHGTEKGLMLFPSYRGFLDYIETDFDAKGTVRIPPHVSLSYGRGADLATHRRKEVSVHGFEVADAHAYPSLMVLDDDLPRVPNKRDLELVGAVASSLARLVEDRRHIPPDAWRVRGTMHTTVVQTLKGRVELTLSIPHDAAEALRDGRMTEIVPVEKNKP